MAPRKRETLASAIQQIASIATKYGLDPYPIHFELCPPQELYAYVARGMPGRYSHWSFGQTSHRLHHQHKRGLAKVYEWVVHANPSYAFLCDHNSPTQNKLIAAHVIAHSDFFKNNAHMSQTSVDPRHILDKISLHAGRIREYERVHGELEVERWLDAVMSIKAHVAWGDEADLLLHIERYSEDLSMWKMDILRMVREETLYALPQLETNIMNEGWATYWHVRIMRNLDLTFHESIEYAKFHSEVMLRSTYPINPYLLGMRLFSEIERRFGLEALFEVRQLDSDRSFLRKYLTPEIVAELDLFLFEKIGFHWVITDKSWEHIRDHWVESCIRQGFPLIHVRHPESPADRRLYLMHSYHGKELDVQHLEQTLQAVFYLWRNPVHLETIVNRRKVLFTYNGIEHHRTFL